MALRMLGEYVEIAPRLIVHAYRFKPVVRRKAGSART